MSAADGWIVNFGGGLPAQIIPKRDLIVHIESVDCPCHPTVSEDGKLVVHHAADGREFSEPELRPEFQEKPQ